MKSLVLAAALALSATSADAALLDFSYTMPETPSQVSGVLTGNVADGIFHITGIQSFSVNGVTQASATEVISADSLLSGIGGAPSIALDNSMIDFLITDPGIFQLFGFAVNDASAHNFGAPIVGGSALFGGPGTFVFFHPEDFSSQLESDIGVPEPASWATMVVGFGLIGGTMRVRRKNTLSPSFAGRA